MNNQSKNVLPLAILVIGLGLQATSLFFVRGHNILLVAGLLCVLFGALKWVRNQKKS